MRFPRKEHWSGLPFPPPGDIPNLGIKPGIPALRGHILYHLNQQGSPFLNVGMVYKVMWRKHFPEPRKKSDWMADIQNIWWGMWPIVWDVRTERVPNRAAVWEGQTLHIIPRAGCRVGSLIPQILHQVHHVPGEFHVDPGARGTMQTHTLCNSCVCVLGWEEMSIINKCLKKSLWECSWFTMLYRFQVYSKVNQLCVCVRAQLCLRGRTESDTTEVT